MKKMINAIRNKAQALAVRTHTFVQDVKGDLATNTIYYNTLQSKVSAEFAQLRAAITGG